jgi:hypothetical protein
MFQIIFNELSAAEISRCRRVAAGVAGPVSNIAEDLDQLDSNGSVSLSVREKLYAIARKITGFISRRPTKASRSNGVTQKHVPGFLFGSNCRYQKTPTGRDTRILKLIEEGEKRKGLSSENVQRSTSSAAVYERSPRGERLYNYFINSTERLRSIS